MVRVLHLAHRHVSVSLLQTMLLARSNEAHVWVFVGRQTGQDDAGNWSVHSKESLPEEIRMAKWDAVVVHKMRHPTPKWLLTIPEGPFILWASWGEDYFRVFPALSKGIYLPKSRLLLGVLCKYSVSILALIQFLRRTLLPASWNVTPRDSELQAMRKADAIANLFGEDFIAKPYLPQVPKHLYSSFYNAVPDLIPNVQASRDPQGPILLGSSASTSGNHLDFIWDHRTSLVQSGRKLQVVLAYGSKRYARAIRALASVALGDNVECLMQKLPLEEYYLFLAASPVVVHNQIRNQNTGNVVLSFLLGHRVLLRSDGLTHRFFSGLGFIIGDACSEELDFSPLDEAGRQHNRALALREFSGAKIMSRHDRFLQDVARSRP